MDLVSIDDTPRFSLKNIEVWCSERHSNALFDFKNTSFYNKNGLNFLGHSKTLMFFRHCVSLAYMLMYINMTMSNNDTPI